MMGAVSEPDPDRGSARELTEVLLDRLGPRPETPQAAQVALDGLRRLWLRRVQKRRGAPALDPDVAALFHLIAIEPSDLEHLTPELAALVERGLGRGLSRDAMPAVFQAYVRAIGRVVAAESALAGELLAQTPVPERPRVLEETLDDLVVIGTRGFDVLHRMLLLDALVDELAALEDPDQDKDLLAVAMVDLVGSTEHLAATEPGELERMVDALFEAGQASTAHRSAYVVKYVGDGLFLAGRDAGDVADAALEVIARLEDALPLPARGGLAAGTVVQRAGDLFGLPINLAHITSKAARPSTLIATEEAARLLPADRCGRFRTISLPHPAVARARITRVRPATDVPPD